MLDQLVIDEESLQTRGDVLIALDMYEMFVDSAATLFNGTTTPKRDKDDFMNVTMPTDYYYGQ